MIYIIGDIHEKVEELNKIIEKISDCFLICVGDLGIGSFKKTINFDFKSFNKKLNEKNIQFYSIRGNHDNPSLFDGKHYYSNLKLLRDYELLIIENKRFLFVGGAVSIDRSIRGKFGYFKGEGFKYDVEQIKECDVLITHSAPKVVASIIGSQKMLDFFSIKDAFLLHDLAEEQENIEKLMKNCKCRYSFHGHFHKSYRDGFNGAELRVLDELEIVEFKY